MVRLDKGTNMKEIEEAMKATKADEKMEKKPSKKDLKIAELTDLLKRVQADFENYKKRVEKEICEFKKFASEELIVKLLPILDNFELSLKNTENKEEFVKGTEKSEMLEQSSAPTTLVSGTSENSLKEFLRGVELIYAQLFELLEKEGLKKIEAVNQKFDPFKHEALMQEKSDKDDIVLEEFQKGFILGDKVIRHSKVKVGKQ